MARFKHQPIIINLKRTAWQTKKNQAATTVNLQQVKAERPAAQPAGEVSQLRLERAVVVNQVVVAEIQKLVAVNQVDQVLVKDK